MHPVTAHSQGANPPRRCLCLYLYCNLSPARCSRVVRALFVRVRTRCSYAVRTLFARCSYAVRTSSRTLFARCSYEFARARTHPRTTQRAPLTSDFLGGGAYPPQRHGVNTLHTCRRKCQKEERWKLYYEHNARSGGTSAAPRESHLDNGLSI